MLVLSKRGKLQTAAALRVLMDPWFGGGKRLN